MLKIIDINKSFNNNPVLKNISFDFSSHKINVIIAANGSGKTTLLKILSTLIKPDSGQIFFKNNLISQSDIFEFRKKLRITFSNNSFYPELTINQNLYFFCSLNNIKTRFSIEKIKQIMNVLFFEEKLLEYKPSQLSSGQIQKYKLIIGFYNNPEIILLDEPFIYLDEETLNNFIIFIKNYNGLIILSVNNPVIMSKISDNILKL